MAYTMSRTGAAMETELDKSKEVNRGVYPIMSYGAVGDGVTADQEAITSALTAAQVTGGSVYFTPGTYLITADTDWSSYTNAILHFQAGAKLSIDALKTVTLYSSASIHANINQHIFSGNGSISFTKGTKITPMWFGALGDNTNDDTDAIQAAIDSADSTADLESVIYFPRGVYLCHELDATNNLAKVSFCGDVPRSVMLVYNGAGGIGSYLIKFPNEGKSFGDVSNIVLRGYDRENASGMIAESALLYPNLVDHMHRLHDVHFQDFFGDAVVYGLQVVNTHVNNVRFDGVGGYCFYWEGKDLMEARNVTIKKFTVDNVLNSTFATRAAALGYYDGTRWGKGLAYLGEVAGVNFTFTDARIEMNKNMVLDGSGLTSLIYSGLTTGTTRVTLDNIGGFFTPGDGGVVVRSVNDKTSFNAENLFFYNTTALFEDGAGVVIHPTGANNSTTFVHSVLQGNGINIQGGTLEFRSSTPSSFAMYKRGDVIFNTNATDGGYAGWIVTEPTSGYAMARAENITTTAVATAASTTITLPANDFRKIFPGIHIIIEGAGVSSADLETYIVSRDPSDNTAVINDAASTSVSVATIKYKVPTFTVFGAAGPSVVLEASTKTDDYTLAIGDQGKIVRMNAAAPKTVTVPTNAAVPFIVGTVIGVYNTAVDAVTISGDTGVTVRNAGDVAQYGEVSLRKRATDEWVLVGSVL